MTTSDTTNWNGIVIGSGIGGMAAAHTFRSENRITTPIHNVDGQFIYGTKGSIHSIEHQLRHHDQSATGAKVHMCFVSLTLGNIRHSVTTWHF